MFGSVKFPTKDCSFFIITWLLLSEDCHIPFFMLRVMIGVYLDELVFRVSAIVSASLRWKRTECRVGGLTARLMS